MPVGLDALDARRKLNVALVSTGDGAIENATGVRMRRVPVLPHRLREAIVAREKGR